MSASQNPKRSLAPSKNTHYLARRLQNSDLIIYPDSSHGAVFHHADNQGPRRVEFRTLNTPLSDCRCVTDWSNRRQSPFRRDSLGFEPTQCRQLVLNL